MDAGLVFINRIRTPWATRKEAPWRAHADLVTVERATVLISGLDCVDGTPLFDLKPDRTLFLALPPSGPAISGTSLSRGLVSITGEDA